MSEANDDLELEQLLRDRAAPVAPSAAFEARLGQALAAKQVALGRAGVGILSLTPELATLEDLFFRLTEDGDDERAELQPAAPAAVEHLVEAR